jgi:hypothetical protein
LVDLGVPEPQRELAELLIADPDLLNFSAPGVNTLVVCGIGLNTTGNATFRTGFGTRGDWEIHAIAVYDGDEVSPRRSCLRGTEWAAEFKTANLQLVHKEYSGMLHATCTHPDPTNSTAPNSLCFDDVLQAING